MIPGKIFTRPAKVQGIVSVNDFWIPRRLQELHEDLLGLLQLSSMTFSNNTSSDVCVALVTSMSFSGTGNDASLGTYSFDSGFHVMTVNKIARNGPEIIPGITIIPR